jgi:hypothetical protein
MWMQKAMQVFSNLNPNILERKICHSHGCQSNPIINMIGQILDNQLDFIIVPDPKVARYNAIIHLPKSSFMDIMPIFFSSEWLFPVKSQISIHYWNVVTHYEAISCS